MGENGVLIQMHILNKIDGIMVPSGKTKLDESTFQWFRKFRLENL